MRKPVTDIALLAYVAKRNLDSLSYTEATKACKSSSSASRALHQLIDEGLVEPKPKLIGLRYVTQYSITPRGKQVSQLALQLSELRESAARMKMAEKLEDETELNDDKQFSSEKELPQEVVGKDRTLSRKKTNSRKTR